MSVYVDPIFPTPRGGDGGGFWPFPMACHLFADTEAELDEFAQQIGLKLTWKQHSGTYKVHYDLTKSKRRQAIAAGAQEIGSFAAGSLLRERLRKAKGGE